MRRRHGGGDIEDTVHRTTYRGGRRLTRTVDISLSPKDQKILDEADITAVERDDEVEQRTVSLRTQKEPELRALDGTKDDNPRAGSSTGVRVQRVQHGEKRREGVRTRVVCIHPTSVLSTRAGQAVQVHPSDRTQVTTTRNCPDCELRAMHPVGGE